MSVRARCDVGNSGPLGVLNLLSDSLAEPVSFILILRLLRLTLRLTHVGDWTADVSSLDLASISHPDPLHDRLDVRVAASSLRVEVVYICKGVEDEAEQGHEFVV